MKEMNVKECIYGRRSIRKYNESKITDDELKEIISAGIHAPSACNFQAWKFIVLNSDEKKHEFLEAYGNDPRGGKPMIENSQQGILVTYRNDLGVSGRALCDYIQSAAAAIQNMLLMATSLGIGSCWICDLPKMDTMRKVFHIPSNYDVIAYVSLGYPVSGGGTSSIASQVYHYGSEENFKLHKRRYTYEQCVSYNEFTIVDGDSTMGKYPIRDYKAKLKEKYPHLYTLSYKLHGIKKRLKQMVKLS